MVRTIIQGAALAISSLFNFARITAGSFGTSIATTAWEHRATLHHAQLVKRMTMADPGAARAIGALPAGGLTPEQSCALLNRIVDQQAFMLSANDVFLGSALIFLALIAVVWLARPAGSAPAGGAAADAH